MEMSEKEGDFMHAIKVIYEWDWFGYAGNDEFKGSSLKAYRGKKGNMKWYINIEYNAYSFKSGKEKYLKKR